MANKKSKIRWRDSDTLELQRAINNFNSKLYRMKKANPALAGDLPDRVKKSEIIPTIETRADFNQVLKSFKNFSSGKTEQEKPTQRGGMRWRAEDEKRLKSTINKFNRKISKLEKKSPEMREYLPDRLNKNDVRDKIGTRKDFNRLLKSYERFNKEGAETPIHGERGNKITKWHEDEFKRRQRLDNARKRREREKILEKEVKIAGEGQGSTRREMGTMKENSLKESHKNPRTMTKSDFEKAFNSLEYRMLDSYADEKKELMRENYLKGLRNSGFLDASPDIEKYVRGLDLDTFLETVETDDTATFLFYKDPQTFEVRRENILASWKTAYESYNKGR